MNHKFRVLAAIMACIIVVAASFVLGIKTEELSQLHPDLFNDMTWAFPVVLTVGIASFQVAILTYKGGVKIWMSIVGTICGFVCCYLVRENYYGCVVTTTVVVILIALAAWVYFCGFEPSDEQATATTTDEVNDEPVNHGLAIFDKDLDPVS